MRKILLLIAVVVMLLPSCKKIEESINALENRIEVLENEAIPTIDEQIVAINTTLGNLDATDKELKGYIDGLQATADNLQEQINATNTKIDEVKVALQNEISTAKAAVLAELEALETELKNELAQINATIETLKAKDAELDKKIADLRTYVDTELGKTTDWVNATFTTLEQLNALSGEVAVLKSLVDANKAEAATNLATAISNLETSLKSWVGEQLSNYYTIAEVDAKILALQNSIKKGDEASQTQLDLLKEDLRTMNTELTTAYQKAIQDAIITNNGVIDTKIANEIATVNQRIDSEAATINAKISAIEARLDNIEARLEDLLARIQSVSYIPTYDDGKATVKYADGISRITLNFEISPKSAVAELAKVWQSAVSVKAVYTQTRALSFINMPIIEFATDTTNGVISVTASGKNLSEEFFSGTQSASVRLSISDGNNSVTSEYVSMVAKAVSSKELGVTPTNEIWYTSSDGKIVTPYKSNVFDANIVSNTYENGKGIITFNGYVTEIGDYAFYNCTSLTSITIPNGVTSIGHGAFYGCTSLTSITIPDSVTEIGVWAFCNCTSLTSVTIPDSVTTIGDWAFSGCTSLKAFYGKFSSSDNHCLIVNGVLNSFAIGCGATEYLIPDSVTSIGYGAFYNCTSLKSVTIPDGVTSIEGDAFSGCTSLKEVYCKPTTPPTSEFGGVFDDNASGCKIYVPRNSVDAYKEAKYWKSYASSIVGYDF